VNPVTGNIETVLFDYGGVIAEEGFRGGLQAIARLNGLDPAQFHEEVCGIIADCGYLTGRADEALFWSQLRQAYPLGQTDQELRAEILGRFVLRPGMLAAVSRLRAAGLRVGIISDQTDWLDELDRRDGFFPFFDRIFNSYHEHASKYDDTLFAVVAAELKAPPGRMLIVDDNAVNIQRARQHGFAAILYTDERGVREELGKVFPLFSASR
jgi:putative hydrolase of the HAD superfamily